MTERCGGLSLNQAGASTPPPSYLTVQTHAAQWHTRVLVVQFMPYLGMHRRTHNVTYLWHLVNLCHRLQSSRPEISQILSGEKWRLWCLFTHPGMAYCPNQHLQTSSLTLAVLKTSRCNGIEMVWVCRRISKKFEVARSRVVRLWAVSRPQLIASTLIQPLLDLTQNRRLQSFMLWSVWKTT